jgi:hypothetical protein
VVHHEEVDLEVVGACPSDLEMLWKHSGIKILFWYAQFEDRVWWILLVFVVVVVVVVLVGNRTELEYKYGCIFECYNVK